MDLQEDKMIEIDTCGYCCPVPMISTLKTLSRLQKGDRIKVIADDDGFEKDIEAVARTGKCKIINIEERDDYAVEVTIEKE